MTVFSLLYASNSMIPAGDAEAAVEAIVDVSRARNEHLGVTGCLIFSGGKFAQVLEGELAAVQELMQSISNDSRHSDVTILEQGTQMRRRFSGWALGYAGQSSFVRRSIAGPVAEALSGSTRGVSDLIRIMVGFGFGRQ